MLKRGTGSMMVLEVALIQIGRDCWMALLVGGGVLLASTRSPRSEVAAELLRQGMDPRAQLTIRSGTRIIACDLLGVMAGGMAMAGDIGVIERDEPNPLM